MIGRTRTGRGGIVAFSAMLTLGAVTAGPTAHAQVVGTPDVVGQWTEPFEENGAAVPRCQPANDGSGFVVCKPTAQAAAVLKDGRIFYYNGIESQENSRGPSAMSLSPSSRDSQVRILDLRSGTPQFQVPKQDRGGQTNPNIAPGHQSYDDPVGAIGVPGRPGDGLVGSTWGDLGGPPHDPTSTPDDPSKNDGDMFCGDVTSLPDGRIMIAGGTDWYNEPAVLDRNKGDAADVGAIELEGLRNTNLFNPDDNSFTPGGNMKYGRWYPHVAIGPDGRPTVFSGVTQLITDTQASQVRRTETYNLTTNQWEENYAGPESENTLPLQPRIILTPDGKFFYTGVGQMWGPFGQAADEALFSLQQSFDPVAKKWEVKGLAPLGARSGAFVAPLTMDPPYDQMTIVAWGGTLGPPPGNWFPANPLTTLTTVDKNGNVTSRMSGNLNHARWFSSGVLLPDGNLIAVGGADKDEVIDPGTDIPVLASEEYNPTSGQWTEVAAHTRDRVYHNSALLLPDMRVLLGGNAPIAAHYGGANNDQGGPFSNNDNDPSFEVWSPPYLFRGERPAITSAQRGISYGETFPIRYRSASDIDSVLLMRTPSPEHVNDSDQRSLRLAFNADPGSNTITATAPPSGNVAPPGTYYLVINRRTIQGPVPSVARIVSVGTGTDLGPALQPYPDDNPAAPIGGSATPDTDSSQMAKAAQQSSEVAHSAPAAAATPAAIATTVAAQAYSQLKYAPAGTSTPASSPLLPAAAIAVAGVATLTGRRWLLGRT
jgi:Domain of unknown function (DUF1929)